MKRTIGWTAAVVMVLALAGSAYAQGPWGMGPGAMGGRGMGPGMMWGGAGPGANAGAQCPVFGAGGQGAAAQSQVTEEKAKELVTQYADKYFKGYTVERVLPFDNGFRTMYQAELKGPKGESRVLHVNPWGAVRPARFPIPSVEG